MIPITIVRVARAVGLWHSMSVVTRRSSWMTLACVVMGCTPSPRATSSDPTGAENLTNNSSSRGEGDVASHDSTSRDELSRAATSVGDTSPQPVTSQPVTSQSPGSETQSASATDAMSPAPTPSASAASNTETDSIPNPAQPRLVVFSKTEQYRHASIPQGVSALQTLAQTRGWDFSATEDAAQLTTALNDANVVVFLSTTGDVLDAAQQTAFETFIAAGNGFVGVHAASDTEYDWAWYGGLVGAYFKAHPAIQTASIVVENTSHLATAQLPNPWSRQDEWYGFRTNPRPDVQVLLTLDESSYAPGDGSMGEDHPIAWYHEYAGGRAFYTALGHTPESYADPVFIAHLEGAIRWACCGEAP